MKQALLMSVAALTLTAGAAQACDMHFGMFDAEPEWLSDPATIARLEAEREAARAKAMEEARLAFLNRFKMGEAPKGGVDARPAPSSVSTTLAQGPDADRRPGSEAQDR